MGAFKPLYAPNGTVILRPSDFTGTSFMGATRAQRLSFAATDFIAGVDKKELAADYAAPIAGSAPNGLGFNFGDSWRRTGRGVMEFNLPSGQKSVINESMRWAAENVFVGKAMRLKTDFTCKGLRNATGDDDTDKQLDFLMRKLNLPRVYRLAVWLYYTAGLVPILFNEPGDPLTFAQILDPRQVRLQEWYGKKFMYLEPDRHMIDAISDREGRSSKFNKDYWDAMPHRWRDQIVKYLEKNGNTAEGLLIRLTPGSYTVIENRVTTISRMPTDWDGAPLQPYFAACQQYRQLMAGDFAAGFLAKNLIALASVGDPKSEGDNYLRPDGTVLAQLQSALQNPNQAMWLYGDPTFNIRYITPDVDTFASSKYDEVRGQLQELLPNCFWSGEDGSFANSATSLMALQDEVDACNEAFDEYFWRAIFGRAADGNPRLAKKVAKPPQHDRNALRDKFQELTAKSALYSNGGLDIRTLIEEHGYDWDAILARLKDQQALVKKGYFMPAFESKQGIAVGALEKAGVIPPSTAIDKVPSTKGLPPVDDSGSTPVATLPDGSTLHVKTAAPAAASGTSSKSNKRKRSRRKKNGGGKAGRPAKVGAARPQPETGNTRAPRPGGK